MTEISKPEESIPSPDGFGEELRAWQAVFEEHDEVIVSLYRRQPNGKLAYLCAIEPDVGEQEIGRVYGGGTYRLQARAGVNARGLKRGNIIQQRSIYIEGPQKTTRYATLHEALEAESRGVPPEPMQAAGQPHATYTLPVGSSPATNVAPVAPTSMDPSLMLAEAFRAMGTMMQQQASRADQRDEHNMKLLMALMTRDQQQRDPIESMDRLFSLAGKIANRSSSDDGAASWIAALPALEPVVDRLARAFENRQAQRTQQAAPPRPSPQQSNLALPTAAPAAEPEPVGPGLPEHRIGLALQLLGVVGTDPEADPHAIASTLASLLGDDAAQALADEPTTVDQLIGAYPDLAARREWLGDVQAALQLMYEADPAAENGTAEERAETTGAMASE